MKRGFAPEDFRPSPPPNHRPTSQDLHTPAPKMETNGNGNDDALGFPISPPPSNDGGVVEVARRSRGRPTGSKNKPKPPVFIARDPALEPSMNPHVLELPPGLDVIEATARFCRRRGVGICVLSGNGLVVNVTLRQPSGIQGAVTFRGRFDILSISATVLPGGGDYPPAASVPFVITLAGSQGQIVGGSVIGPLVSAGKVYLFGATFNTPAFERLQTADQDDAGAAEGGGREPQQAVNGGEIGVPPIYGYQAANVPARQTHPPSPALYRPYD